MPPDAYASGSSPRMTECPRSAETPREPHAGGSTRGGPGRREYTGWKRARGTAIASRSDTPSFCVDLARWAADRGFLRLFALRLNGVAIAVDYCLEDRDVRYVLKEAFDPRFASCSPGSLLLEESLAHAARTGITEVELRVVPAIGAIPSHPGDVVPKRPVRALHLRRMSVYRERAEGSRRPAAATNERSRSRTRGGSRR